MEIILESKNFSTISTEALVTYAFDHDNRIEGVVAEIDRAMDGRLAPLAASGELTGKAFEMVLLHYPGGLAAQRLLLVGAGKREKFSTTELRKIAGAAGRYLKPRGVKKFSFLLREGEYGLAAVQAVAE